MKILPGQTETHQFTYGGVKYHARWHTSDPDTIVIETPGTNMPPPSYWVYTPAAREELMKTKHNLTHVALITRWLLEK